MPTVDLSERDNKETLFVKEEAVTNDAEVFREVVVDVEVSQQEPSSYYERGALATPTPSSLPPSLSFNPFSHFLLGFRGLGFSLLSSTAQRVLSLLGPLDLSGSSDEYFNGRVRD